MSALLMFLKICGITLLVILCVLALLVLLILFVPVRYRLSGSSSDPDGQEDFDLEKLLPFVRGEASVSWLLHLIRWKALYADGKAQTSLYILFFRIDVKKVSNWWKNRKAKKDKKPDNEAQRQLDADLAAKKSGKKAAENSEIDGNTGKGSAESIRDNPGNDKGHLEEATPGDSQTTDSSENDRTNALAGKFNLEELLQAVLARIVNAVDHALDAAERLTGKFTRKAETAQNWLSLLQKESSQEAIRHLLSESGYILKRLLPKRWSVNGTVGLGDPCNTGKFLEVMGFLYPVTRGHMDITPEYMKYQLNLEADAKGHIAVISVAIAAVRLLMDQRVKRLHREAGSLRRKAA